MKTLTRIAFTAAMIGIFASPSYAETVTKTTTTVTTIREDAPIYMGPVNESELQELTLADFQQFGNKPIAAMTLYNEYKQELNQPKPNPTRVLYKIKITDRNLVLMDFQADNVSPQLAQARYNEYLRLNPVSVDGQNVRYVYVYHSPITLV